ncbi:MAG: NAD(+)/NADH kinase [Candidatus Peregrinibacteria bacterium]|nr:NAD(+)/NADH kinase [Candidatus Peregrinibacteria bacterium]
MKKVKTYLEKQGCEVFLDSNAAPLIDKKPGYKKKEMMEFVDMAILLGGDGTILKTARRMPPRKVLLLPVNLGTLGFLTETPADKLFNHLDRIFVKKRFVIDERMLLRTTVYRKGRKIESFLALNEAAITQGSFARVIEMNVEVNQRKLMTIRGDGLIVSTPTGSTGHGLSAGGPVVNPGMEAFILTPVCPIALSNRPIVMPNDRQLKITVLSEKKDNTSRVGLTLDGQVIFPLLHGDEIKIRASSRKVRIIRMTGQNYYKMLRQKLGWGV